MWKTDQMKFMKLLLQTASGIGIDSKPSLLHVIVIIMIISDAFW